MAKVAIVVMGKPASGKSTLAKQIAEMLNAHYTSTGDLARLLPFSESWQELGLMAPEKMLREAFEHDIRGKELVVVDGMPRKAEQVDYLDAIFDRVHYYLLSISDMEVMERLSKRGRSDDTPVAIKQRLADYNRLTEPAIKKIKGKHSMTLIATSDTKHVLDSIFERFEGGA